MIASHLEATELPAGVVDEEPQAIARHGAGPRQHAGDALGPEANATAKAGNEAGSGREDRL